MLVSFGARWLLAEDTDLRTSVLPIARVRSAGPVTIQPTRSFINEHLGGR
jgi:hypothetical protein